MSTFRADTTANLLTVLNAYVTANPTLLKRAYKARPASSPDVPFAYIDGRSETIRFDQGTQNRVLSGLSFVVVDKISDNGETADRLDTLVDGLVSHLAGYPQLGATYGVWSQLNVTDEDWPFGDYDFAAVRFAFPDISLMEGRT